MTVLPRHGRGERAVLARAVPENVVLVIAAALVLWTLRALHQSACNTGDDKLNTMLRLCYSDLPVLWRGGLAQGGLPYRQVDLDLPPLIGGIVLLTQQLTLWAGPITDAESARSAEVLFVWINVALLGGAFLVLVLCHLWVSRQLPSLSSGQIPSGQTPSSQSPSLRLSGGRAAGRIALLTATCLGVFTAGTISWALVPAALVAVALVLWGRRRCGWAGAVLGLAASAAWYPWLVLVAWLILCWRADRMRGAMTAALATAAVWSLFTLPVLLWAPHGWITQAKAALTPPIGLGSVWFVLQQLTGSSPAVWVVSAVAVVLATAGVAAICQLAPRRPRVAQVAALLVLTVTITAPVYSPQQVLWIAPLVLLARPVMFDWAVFCAAEAIYWAAVWGHLQGNLGTGTPINFYVAAIVLRVAVQVVIAVRIALDMLRPWHDPVRRGHVDDPLGGVLDHAADRAPVERFALDEVIR